MGRMATVTPFLNHVTTLAESGPNLLWDAEILSLDSHSVKPNRVTALSELLQLFFMAFPAFFRENHGLLIRSSLVVDVAGDTMDPILCVFGFDP